MISKVVLILVGAVCAFGACEGADGQSAAAQASSGGGAVAASASAAADSTAGSGGAGVGGAAASSAATVGAGGAPPCGDGQPCYVAQTDTKGTCLADHCCTTCVLKGACALPDGKQPSACGRDGEPCAVCAIGFSCINSACACAPVAPCDDCNPCTSDVGAEPSCAHTPLPDGSVCAAKHVCASGACVEVP